MITEPQICRRTPRFILFSALLLGLGAWPLTAMPLSGDSTTQAPATANAQPNAASGSDLKQEVQAEKSSEAEDTQKYRHSASVQWLARLLHLDVETAAKIFEYINFAVILLAVGIPLLRILPAAMRRRSAKLSADLEVAKAKTEDANDRLKAVEEKMAGLDAEIAEIRKQVEEQMRADDARAKAVMEEETARIVAAAEHEIAVAGSMVQRALQQFAADLAIDRAVSQLTIDADTDRALFAEFALDVARKPGGKRRRAEGGQN